MNDTAQRLKALADPGRLKVLALVSAAGEICVCKIEEALKLPQPTVSRHLNRLKEAGWLQDRRAGKWVNYRLANPKGSPWRQILDKVLSQTHGLFSKREQAAFAKLLQSSKAGIDRIPC